MTRMMPPKSNRRPHLQMLLLRVRDIPMQKITALDTSLEAVVEAKGSDSTHDSGAEDLEYPAKSKTLADRVGQLYRTFVDVCVQLPASGTHRVSGNQTMTPIQTASESLPSRRAFCPRRQLHVANIATTECSFRCSS